MASAAPTLENLTLNLTQGIHVRGPLDETFAVLLEQIGPKNETPDVTPTPDITPIPLKTKPWPRERWYRDLGDGKTISGDMCRPSGGQRCLKSQGRCSCPIRSFRTCSAP